MAVAELELTQRDTPHLNICCKRCGGNAGRIENGALIYSVKHSGERHTIRIDLEHLYEILLASKPNSVKVAAHTG